MTQPLQYQITPLQLYSVRVNPATILDRWTQVWATGGTSGGVRLLSSVLPYSFQPYYLAYYAAGKAAPQGSALQRWRWDQAWMYRRMEEESNPHTIDHRMLAFVDGDTQRETFRFAVKTAFGLPAVDEVLLPPYVYGSYREHAAMLEPIEEGYPYMTVLTAYEAAGEWGLHTWAELLYGDIPLVICMDIRTMPREQARWSARLAYNRFVQAAHGHLKDPDMERARDAAGSAMDRLYTEAMHLVGYHILVYAGDARELEERCISVRQTMSGLLSLDRLACQGELIKFFTTTPTRQIAAPDLTWNLMSRMVAVSTPWALSKDAGRSGVCWGIGATGLPIIKSLWREMLGGAAHIVIVGKTGAGKTTNVFIWLARHYADLDDPAQIVYVDPAGNGKRLTDAMGNAVARFVELGGDETINPLDVVSTDLGAQVAAVTRKLSVIMGHTSGDRNTLVVHPRELTALEDGALDLACQRLYGPEGEHLPAMQADRIATPLLPALVDALDAVVAAYDLTEVRPFALQTRLFLDTTKGRRFSQPTTIPWRFDKEVISYSFWRVPDTLLPIFMLIVMEGLDRYVRTRPREADGRRRHLIACVDEFKLLGQVPDLRAYAEAMVRWWRQLDAAGWFCDQTIGTFLGAAGGRGQDAGHAIAANVAATFFFNLAEADLEILEQVYGAVLGPAEIERIRLAKEGEGIALFGTRPEYFYVAPTGLERAAFLHRTGGEDAEATDETPIAIGDTGGGGPDTGDEAGAFLRGAAPAVDRVPRSAGTAHG